MTVLIDTSVLIDVLQQHPGAEEVLERVRAEAQLLVGDMTRLEVLAGMRPTEEVVTRALVSILIWHPVDAGGEVCSVAGSVGRRVVGASASEPLPEGAEVLANAFHLTAQ